MNPSESVSLCVRGCTSLVSLFFFNDTATTEIYPLSLHDALPISSFSRMRLSWWVLEERARVPDAAMIVLPVPCMVPEVQVAAPLMVTLPVPSKVPPAKLDRKSTRLNSSHANISYAVFCLKKKYGVPFATGKNQKGVSYGNLTCLPLPPSETNGRT